MIKNLAQLKREAKNYIFTMIQHSWYPTGDLIGLPRKVQKLQSNALQFVNGSWLFFDSAKNYKFQDNQMIVDLNQDGTFRETMIYKLENI